MQFFRQQDVRPQPGETVYRHSVLPKIIGALITGGMAGFLLWCAWRGGIPHEKFADLPQFFLWVFGGTFLLVSLAARSAARAAMAPASNWLLRLGPGGLTVKFRSYLNRHLPADDVVAFGLSFSDIEWARHVRETRYSPGSKQGQTNVTWLHHLEIQPGGGIDLPTLTDHLNRERANKGPRVKRWYGNTAWKSHDYPVTVTPQGTIRVHWQVRPGVDKLLDKLRTRITVRPYHKEKNDLRGGGQTDAEKLEAVRTLAQISQFGAIRVARSAFGLPLSEAKQLVEALAAGDAPGADEEVTAFIAKAGNRVRTPVVG
jgi:hypothetical protein